MPPTLTPRVELGHDLARVGHDLAAACDSAVRLNMPFTAGLLRAAKEAIQTAHDGVTDAAVLDGEL